MLLECLNCLIHLFGTLTGGSIPHRMLQTMMLCRVLTQRGLSRHRQRHQKQHYKADDM